MKTGIRTAQQRDLMGPAIAVVIFILEPKFHLRRHFGSLPLCVPEHVARENRTREHVLQRDV